MCEIFEFPARSSKTDAHIKALSNPTTALRVVEAVAELVGYWREDGETDGHFADQVLACLADYTTAAGGQHAPY